MSPGETLFWKRVADDLGIDVTTPFEAPFTDGTTLQVAALVRNFGAARGMLVNADYDVLEPHTRKILKSGYGFSSKLGTSPDQYERSSMIEVLKDWGWSGAGDQKPTWLSTPANTADTVLVVLDPNFGDRLRDAWSCQPVWIAMSPLNATVVRTLWTTAPTAGHLTGITGFTYDPDVSAEDRLLAELNDIDLHHGAYSTATPYTRLEVIGAQLSSGVQAALALLGFSEFRRGPEGFIALRNAEQARLLRD